MTRAKRCARGSRISGGKTMRGRIAAVAFLLSLVAAPAAAPWDFARDRFDIDAAHSSITFSIEFMGLTRVDGRFTRYSGTMLYDEADLTRSTISVAIRTDSIFTASDFRDRHLKSPDFFDAEKFPVILFRSARVVRSGGSFVVHGTLTMHGVTKEVAIPFTRAHGRMKDMWENTRVGFVGKLKLDRRDFGIVGPPSWERTLDLGRLTIGHEVEITLSIQGRTFNWDRISGGPKSLDGVLMKTFEEKGLEAAMAQYREMKASPEVEKMVEGGIREGGLNTLGYKLLYRNKVTEAIEIFKVNAEAFPNSASAYDSLAEAYAIRGDKEPAVAKYKKSLALDPNNISAMEMLRHLSPN